MKNGLLIAVLATTMTGLAQPKDDHPVSTRFSFPKAAEVDMKKVSDQFATTIIREMPPQGPRKGDSPVTVAPLQRQQAYQAALPPLTLGQSFFGNSFNLSTPSDNDIAVSDSGIAVSVMNTNILIRDTRANTNINRTLAGFTHPINNFHEEFDPKVVYDSRSNRFVLVTLVGRRDSTSKVVIGFSQTEDPAGIWNLYTLPGNPLNNNLWTDYPMITLNEKEAFLTVNLLYEDSSWQTGFVQTLIWQMKKDSGYAGKPLGSVLHSNIKYNGKALRNLCPVKAGTGAVGRSLFFLSNRNFASSNDTVFLVRVTDTIGSSNLAVTVKALKSNMPYFFPPDARQTAATQSLATNDSRNLGALYHNDMIQYVHNTCNNINGHSSIYYGTISGASSASPVAKGYVLQNDSMDFGYPNISLAAIDSTSNISIVSFLHSSDKVNAGISAVQADGTGKFSPILRIASGGTYVNLLISDLERWGDYSGSQRIYGNPGEVWINGYYAYRHNSSYPYSNGTWIAQLMTDERINLSAPRYSNSAPTELYPNPSKGIFTVEFSLDKPSYITASLFDLQGKLISPLYRDMVRSPRSILAFNAGELPAGTYLVKITGAGTKEIVKKVIIE